MKKRGLGGVLWEKKESLGGRGNKKTSRRYKGKKLVEGGGLFVVCLKKQGSFGEKEIAERENPLTWEGVIVFVGGDAGGVRKRFKKKNSETGKEGE